LCDSANNTFFLNFKIQTVTAGVFCVGQFTVV